MTRMKHGLGGTKKDSLLKTLVVTIMSSLLFSSSHGQTAETVSSAKSSQGQPFWRATVMDNEPVLFIRNEGEPFATGKLLFMPSAQPTIMAPDLVMKYEEGKDYVWKSGSDTIELTAGTRIPFKTSAEMVPSPGSPNTMMGVLFSEGHFFHDLQVQVSYPHAADWPLQDAPPAQLLTAVLPNSMSNNRSSSWPLATALPLARMPPVSWGPRHINRLTRSWWPTRCSNALARR